jgi:MFS family permease
MAKLSRKIASHPLIDTLIHAKGNERACLITEPLWGIPYNLYVPFVSVYMAALGMTPLMIGLTATVFFASQMIWALVGGILTDKMGRRLCTLVFDFLCWSVPSFLWMLAQNEYWFLIAALFNGMIRVTENSWTLLFVEEAPESKLVHLYSLANIAGLIAGFVAPVSYFFVDKYSVVPTMRVLYGITFVLMTTKFVLLYFLTHETEIGKRRQGEFQHRSMPAHLLDSRHVLAKMLKTRKVMYTVALLACFGAIRSVIDNFWPLLITEKLGIEQKYLSMFAMLRSLVFVFGYFLFTGKLDVRKFKKPLLIAFSCFGAVQCMLVFLNTGSYWMLGLGVFAEALSLSVLSPLTSSLQMLSMDREERARMNGLFLAMCLLITSPVGALAGALAEADRSLPFLLTLALCGLALILSLKVWQINREEEAPPAKSGVAI